MATIAAILFPLTLYPPLAFDETLYHLPFVRALAASGQLRFLADARFPVFPQLHEVLCVPMGQFAGDSATHLVALAEVLITAALLIDWGRRAGALAAALFLGSPLVVFLATVTHVDAALTLFVVAGFYCLERSPALAGFFFGTACSVKYLGWFFAVAALVVVVITKRRSAFAFALCCAAAALPTTLWLFATTRDPLFPFLVHSPWTLPRTPTASLLRIVMLPWNATFARQYLNFEPPLTPLLIPMIAATLAAALRDARARVLVVISAVYLAVFAFLPQDSRYLVPLLPLVSLAAATEVVARWPRLAGWPAWIAALPGIAYAVYRLALIGSPLAAPQAILAARVPEYTALMHADAQTVYVCGAEQLKLYARGRLLGDLAGPYAYARVLGDAHDTATIAARLRAIDARWFLVAKRVCAPPRANGGLELVYEDGAAQLWRVQRSQSSP